MKFTGIFTRQLWHFFRVIDELTYVTAGYPMSNKWTLTAMVSFFLSRGLKN
jgi:hypothetical protein